MLRRRRLGPRVPQQNRAKLKVELILEAAMELLDGGGLSNLTTNALAEKAGVSVGTIYQYFTNKEAILDALADREVAGISDRVVAAMQDPSTRSLQDRTRRIVRAISMGYGERPRVHRIMIDYSLSRKRKLLLPLIRQVSALLATTREQAVTPALDPAETFVLTHSFVGVMRAIILREEGGAPTEDEIEEC